jgi:hypothetical protein
VESAFVCVVLGGFAQRKDPHNGQRPRFSCAVVIPFLVLQQSLAPNGIPSQSRPGFWGMANTTVPSTMPKTTPRATARVLSRHSFGSLLARSFEGWLSVEELESEVQDAGFLIAASEPRKSGTHSIDVPDVIAQHAVGCLGNPRRICMLRECVILSTAVQTRDWSIS